MAGVTLVARDRPRRLRVASGAETMEVAPGAAVAMEADGEDPHEIYIPPDLYPANVLPVDDLLRGELGEDALSALEADEPLSVAVEDADDIDVRELRAARQRAAESGRDLIVTFVDRHGRGGAGA